MRRTVGPFVVTQPAVGAAFTLTTPQFRPPVGQLWKLLTVRVEVPNYVAGSIKADVFLDGVKIAGTNQGQGDTCQPSGTGLEICTIYDGSNLSITWAPTRVPGIVQGRATLTVDQEPRSATR